MATWLLKTEPSTYSIADLQREKRTRWDGVKNAAALLNLRKMMVGDQVLLYHTGSEKAVVGIARVFVADTKDGVITLEYEKTLRHPVPLSAIKADKAFKEFALVKISRLSAMPVSAEHHKRILSMGA
ncbi:MAG TPA: EVE domain-containing protein [Gemmatimonadales bacterium]|nr:EVE domain-containing protein [Gemmatimonadales bacterium]